MLVVAPYRYDSVIYSEDSMLDRYLDSLGDGLWALAMRLSGWVKAFRGFYDENDPVARQDIVARFLFAARSLILIISAQAAVIAGLLAYVDSAFNLLYFSLILFAFVTIHAVSNLLNDYFGFLRGHDTPDSPRRRYTLHPLADGILTRSQMRKGIVLMVLFDVAIGAFFTAVRGPLIILFMLVGLAMLLLYDAAPRPLKSVGLGEPAAFVVWGPLMIFGGYFAISGRLSMGALLVSIPYGLGVMTILVGKHIDQESYDRPHGVRTLPVLVGEARARGLAATAIVLMYVFTVVSVIYGALAVTSMIVLLNYRKAASALGHLSRERPSKPPDGYRGWPLWYHRFCLLHNQDFGYLYILGLIIAAIFASSPLAHILNTPFLPR